MATVTKSPASLVPRHSYFSRAFKGLDLFHAPRDLSEGYLTQADGLLLEAGRLVTRPGLVGQWAAALGSPVYVLLEFVGDDGTLTTILTSGGKIYKWAAPATSPTELLNGGVSFAINSANARMAQLRSKGYLVDGTGPLVVLDLTGGSNSVGLSAPATAPPASLTGSLLAQLNLASSWSSDGSSPAGNLLPNYTGNMSAAQFPNASAGTGWTTSADANLNGALLNLDDVGENALSDALVNPAFTGNPGLHAKKLRVTGPVIIDAVGTNNNRVSVVVSAYSDVGGTALISSLTHAIPNPAAANTTYDHTFDFTSAGVEILAWKVKLINTAGSNGPNHFWVNQWQAFPVGVAVSFADGSPGVQMTVTESGSPTVLDLAGVAIYATLPALSGDPGQTLTLDLANADKWTGLGFTVAGQLSGSSAWTSLGTLTLTSDLSKGYVDISSLSAAERQSIAALRLTFTNNVTLTSAGAYLMLGPLVGGGNLTVGDKYDWLYTEIDDEGDVTLVMFIESAGSPHSASLTAQPDAATGLVTLPSAPLNAASTHFALYRWGGPYPDGRLVAREQWGVDDAAGSLSVPPNPYVSWSHTTHVLRDNTPDSFLLYADTYEAGHEGPPAGAQCVAAHQNRLVLAVGATLYLSWEVTGNERALYFNRLSDPSDPNAAVQGGVFPTQTQSPINALVSFGTASSNYNVNYGTILVAFKPAPAETSVLFGTNGADFKLVSYLVGTGVGCEAGRCALVVNNAIWFLGKDGWHRFDAEKVDERSLPVTPALAPGSYGGASLNAAAVRGSAAVYHGRRLWHFTPLSSTDTANAGAYAWDSRADGWTRPVTAKALTSAVSSGSVSGTLYAGGADGMLYALDPAATTDKATSGGSAAGIAWAAAGRGYGQETNSQDDLWHVKQATRVHALVESRETGTVAAGVTVEGRAWTAAGYPTSGTPSVPVTAVVYVKPPADVRGRCLEATLSGTATKRLAVAAFGVDVAVRALK